MFSTTVLCVVTNDGRIPTFFKEAGKCSNEANLLASAQGLQQSTQPNQDPRHLISKMCSALSWAKC